MAGRLHGKVVVITGSGSGTGRATARLAAKEGALVVVSDLYEDRAKNAAELIRSEGGTAIGIRADVSIEHDMDALVEQAVAEFGRLDVMHANAGIMEPSFGTDKMLHQEDTSDWQKVFNVNALGVYLAFRSAVGVFLSQGTGGVLLATTSAASEWAYPGFGLYTSSKHAATGIVKAFAVHYGGFGIRANALAPFAGSMNFFHPGGEVKDDWDRLPTNGVSPVPLLLDTAYDLNDNAAIAVFLMSDDARYLSGEVIRAGSGAAPAKAPINMPTISGGRLPPEVVNQMLSGDLEQISDTLGGD